MENKTNKKNIATAFIVAVILVIIDQVIKVIIANSDLEKIISKEIIPGLLNLTYVENTGAAFGMFKNGTLILGIFSVVLVIGMIVVILRGMITDKKVVWALSIIAAGGLGNIIDRFIRGYVIDYIDVRIGFLKSFPIFNFADCCVTIGAVLLAGFVLLPTKKVEATPNNEAGVNS